MPIIIPDGLPYSPPSIECLRFGARRGGQGIGCCAVDVLQGFNNDPDAEGTPIPFFDGDSWTPVMNYDGDESEQLHVVGTNEQIFLSYLIHGSFTPEPVNDHAWIAILTEEQCGSYTGQKWLRILHREGFKYVTTVNNGVYSEYHPNHIFILTRNTDENISPEELGPPSLWQELEENPKSRQEIQDRYYEIRETLGEAHEYRPPVS